jgi:hypothetical protein
VQELFDNSLSATLFTANRARINSISRRWKPRIEFAFFDNEDDPSLAAIVVQDNGVGADGPRWGAAAPPARAPTPSVRGCWLGRMRAVTAAASEYAL